MPQNGKLAYPIQCQTLGETCHFSMFQLCSNFVACRRNLPPIHHPPPDHPREEGGRREGRKKMREFPPPANWPRASDGRSPENNDDDATGLVDAKWFLPPALQVSVTRPRLKLAGDLPPRARRNMIVPLSGYSATRLMVYRIFCQFFASLLVTELNFPT